MPDGTLLQLPVPDDVQPRPTTDEEIGVTLNVPFGSYDGEVFNPTELDIPDLLKRIDTMLRTDGHFRALARLLSLPFRQAKWSIQPDEDGEDEADFITQMLTRPPYQGGMTTSFDYVRSLAAKAFWQGYAVWEEVYAYADIPGHGTKLVLRKLAPRDAATVTFKADEYGGFDGIVQRASDGRGGMRTIHINRDKVLFYVVDKEEHPFYGRSMFEPALYHFDKKHKLYYIAHIAAQIAAVPARVAYQETSGGKDLTTTQRTQLERALAGFGFNTAMIADARDPRNSSSINAPLTTAARSSSAGAGSPSGVAAGSPVVAGSSSDFSNWNFPPLVMRGAAPFWNTLHMRISEGPNLAATGSFTWRALGSASNWNLASASSSPK